MENLLSLVYIQLKRNRLSTAVYVNVVLRLEMNHVQEHTIEKNYAEFFFLSITSRQL